MDLQHTSSIYAACAAGYDTIRVVAVGFQLLLQYGCSVYCSAEYAAFQRHRKAFLHLHDNPSWHVEYGKYPIILYHKVSAKMAYAISADSDQKEHSSQVLLCLPFHQVFYETTA